MIFHRYQYVSLLLSLLVLSSCTALRKSQPGTSPETAIELDTVDFVIQADALLPYQQPADRALDVLHMELDLSFGWEEEEVYGVAKLQLTPYHGALDSLRLNARGFEMKNVLLVGEDTTSAMEYVYQGTHLIIPLKDQLAVGDTLQIEIGYTARPTLLDKGSGRAITSAQGLYFINPKNEVPDKPRQIWSQGETTYNSGWFPCVDEPHEKFTQEIFLTVDQSFQTISNGKLMYSSQNEDGTRTDYWKQSMPHSTYLVMIAIGEWAIHEDEWEGLPVWYYVDSAYAEDAEAIFGNTPEMLSFYSERLGVKYPWDKYHQVVVEDFVSGAMENTSAVIHGDFVQLTRRELLDNSYESVIAHELFHHWFGDLVTCESWSQITMNEGFATYGEYLWHEHKYGEQFARFTLDEEGSSYFNEAMRQPKSLIRYRYNDPDDLFDSHSYQKGGLILHMLRAQLGDAAFFEGVSDYLNEHAYSTVEDDDLRQALEHSSGQDLRWFFDDWYYMPGHPEMEITWEEDSTGTQLILSLEQTQTSDRPFRHWAEVVIGYAHFTDTHRVWVDEWKERYMLSLEEPFSWYAVDPDHDLLWERDETKNDAVWLAQMEHNQGYHSLDDAMANADLDDEALLPEFLDLFVQIMSDQEPYFKASRVGAIQSVFKLPEIDTNRMVRVLTDVFRSDSSSMVRSAALFALDSLSEQGLDATMIHEALNDTSFDVMRTALSVMMDRDACRGLSATKAFSSEEKDVLLTWVSRLHAMCADPASLTFFKEEAIGLEGFSKFLFNNDFGTFAETVATEEAFDALVKQLSKEALDETSWWARLAALQSLEKALSFYEGEVERLETVGEQTTDQTEHLAKLRNKKASLAALIDEAKELQGEDQQFID